MKAIERIIEDTSTLKVNFREGVKRRFVVVETKGCRRKKVKKHVKTY